jgi:hypothetical protein
VLFSALYSALRLVAELIQLQTQDSKALQAEVLALRQQVRVLERQVKRVRWQPSDRLILSVLREWLPRSAWAGLLVQPETGLAGIGSWCAEGGRPTGVDAGWGARRWRMNAGS